MNRTSDTNNTENMIALTKDDYREMVQNKLVVGDEIEMSRMVRSDGEGNLMVRKTRTFTVEMFCENFVVFKDRSGFMTTYGYYDVYKMLKGEIL